MQPQKLQKFCNLNLRPKIYAKNMKITIPPIYRNFPRDFSKFMFQQGESFPPESPMIILIYFMMSGD